ncbi:MAG: bifunctional riboflavin kinase/FAD synthetase [Phocaeicola sp.]|nr:bifunctional riboflavin kinase/FAD synthetase [Phocaeicola sp.]MDD7448154.1 bifunctional riboflavin kinase/FAD synthetase [Prevotellaceae bacterium]MDY3913680.1 bifunctional riboflavin kinase/FAD synthetase [Phocaeicola sp.]MDY5938699.1 bifunctional riboflavin kinase/FAD synthetase [Phocaeicola sp.]
MHIIETEHSIYIKPCVATIGFFDGVHRGHTFLIEEVKDWARKQGLQSMLITFSEHPKKVLYPEEQITELSTAEEKITYLSKTGIDACLLLPFTLDLAKFTALSFMRLLHDVYKVQTLIVGHDHRFGHNRGDGFEQYRHYGEMLGMQVIAGRALEENGYAISSSLIRKLIATGELSKANAYLGYYYTVRGTVIRGFQMGRKMGFPTANISLTDTHKLLPMCGVYAVFVEVKGQKYKGMLDIGTRPTMENGNHITIEVHILDFNEDIYGEQITVEFVRYLRADIKFSSIPLLIEQLKKDEILTREILNC